MFGGMAYQAVDEVAFGGFAAGVTVRGRAWRWAGRAHVRRT
jgi:hypothetical protein